MSASVYSFLSLGGKKQHVQMTYLKADFQFGLRLMNPYKKVKIHVYWKKVESFHSYSKGLFANVTVKSAIVNSSHNIDLSESYCKKTKLTCA